MVLCLVKAVFVCTAFCCVFLSSTGRYEDRDRNSLCLCYYMKSRTLAFAVMNKMAVSWFFVCCRCPLLERPEKVLCSLGYIGTCRDRIDATVCISNHSLALRLPRDFLELSGGRSSDGWFQQYIATNTWNAWSQVVKFLFWPASNDLTKMSCPSFSIHSHQRETSAGG